MHWACKRGNEEIVRILLSYGADPNIQTNKSETPVDLCTNPSILELLGAPNHVPCTTAEDLSLRFIPNYLRNPPLNGTVDVEPKMRPRHADFTSMPTTTLPAQNDGNYFTVYCILQLLTHIIAELVLRVRIYGSNDPDFIEIEIPRWKLTYSALLSICCEELNIKTSQVERIRKLPNTRLRKDSDVKRLIDNQGLEVVLKTAAGGEKHSNCYQSISTCKDQTILY